MSSMWSIWTVAKVKRSWNRSAWTDFRRRTLETDFPSQLPFHEQMILFFPPLAQEKSLRSTHRLGVSSDFLSSSLNRKWGLEINFVYEPSFLQVCHDVPNSVRARRRADTSIQRLIRKNEAGFSRTWWLANLTHPLRHLESCSRTLIVGSAFFICIIQWHYSIGYLEENSFGG